MSLLPLCIGSCLLTVKQSSVDIGNHGTNVTRAVFLLDLIYIFLAGLVKVFVVAFVDRVDLASRR